MKSFRGSNCKFRFFTIPLWKADRHLVAVIWTIRSDSRVRWPREHLPSSSRPSRPNNANRSTPRVRDTKLTSNNTRSNPLPPSNPTASPAEVLQTANTTKKSCVVCPRCWIWYIPRGGCVGLYEFGSPGSLEGLRPDPPALGSSHTPHTTPVPFFPSLLNATYRPLRGGDDLEGEGFYKKPIPHFHLPLRIRTRQPRYLRFLLCFVATHSRN